MRTDESLLASWLPRHRVLHLSGRNLLLGLLCVLAGLGLLGWCLYWLNNDHNYKIATYLLLPASWGFVGLGIRRVLRFRLLLRLVQLLFSLSVVGSCLVALFLVRLSSLTTDLSPVMLAFGLLTVVGIPALLVSGCLAAIRKLRQTRQ